MSKLADKLRATQRYEMQDVGLPYNPWQDLRKCEPKDGEWFSVDDIPLAELADLVEAAEEIANDGCGVRMPPEKECRFRYPDDRGEWCWCCMAADTLEALARAMEVE